MSRDVEVIRNFVEHFPPFQLLPIWALLRLEKATDPTVSFSRIINCARLTASQASNGHIHPVAYPSCSRC